MTYFPEILPVRTSIPFGGQKKHGLLEACSTRKIYIKAPIELVDFLQPGFRQPIQTPHPKDRYTHDPQGMAYQAEASEYKRRAW
jgi:hypothetical protein